MIAHEELRLCKQAESIMSPAHAEHITLLLYFYTTLVIHLMCSVLTDSNVWLLLGNLGNAHPLLPTVVDFAAGL